MSEYPHTVKPGTLEPEMQTILKSQFDKMHTAMMTLYRLQWYAMRGKFREVPFHIMMQAQSVIDQECAEQESEE